MLFENIGSRPTMAQRPNIAEKVTVEFNVPARMRDGTILYANVYRPDGAGPWPTLLTRTPYQKEAAGFSGVGLDPVQMARIGFIVVIQDVRGRYASEGAWEPFAHEGHDGYDSVEWAAALRGSNGRVGMFGQSYCGNTQWLAALEQPPSLAAISPAFTWSDPMDGLFARGGAVELGVTLSWSTLAAVNSIQRSTASGSEIRRRIEDAIGTYDELDRRGYWELPVGDITILGDKTLADLGGLAALRSPDVAERCRVAGQYDLVKVPTFHTTGWYDNCLQGTIDNYQAMRDRGLESHLIIGPWTHVALGDPIGQEVFGLRASRAGVPVHGEQDGNALELAWLRRHLDPNSTVECPDAPVRIFVMGTNEWEGRSSWPPPCTLRRWYLRRPGALTADGPQPDSEETRFTSNPGDPVPTVGGNTVLSAHYPAGPIDQARIERRADVCVFTSGPLEADLEIGGRVCVVLHAQSSVPSTDWVARLCDVSPDGRSINLCDGILRVAGAADRCRRYEVDLWSTGHRFRRGHRLRVHVTSSSFPRWDRNLHTGNQARPEYQTAEQLIYHDVSRPSYIELPLAGR